MKNSVCGIIITYNGGQSIKENVARLAAQVEHVVVVDNGSGNETLQAIEESVLLSGTRLTTIFNQENVGVASALNQGVRVAVERNFRFVLTMDQDSQIAPDMVERLLEAYALCPGVGTVGPRMSYSADKGAVEFGEKADPGIFVIEMESVWTSGSLVPCDLYKTVGGYRDDLFIDNVDIEFCHRVRRAGLKVIEASRAKLKQQIGDVTVARFFGRRCYVLNYSPARRYFRARNCMALRNEIKDKSFFWPQVHMLLNDAIKILLFEDGKLMKLSMMLLGFWHGITGRLGPLTKLDRKPQEPIMSKKPARKFPV